MQRWRRPAGIGSIISHTDGEFGTPLDEGRLSTRFGYAISRIIVADPVLGLSTRLNRATDTLVDGSVPIRPIDRRMNS
jgi:hypothetical protein